MKTWKRSSSKVGHGQALPGAKINSENDMKSIIGKFKETFPILNLNFANFLFRFFHKKSNLNSSSKMTVPWEQRKGDPIILAEVNFRWT